MPSATSIFIVFKGSNESRANRLQSTSSSGKYTKPVFARAFYNLKIKAGPRGETRRERRGSWAPLDWRDVDAYGDLSRS